MSRTMVAIILMVMAGCGREDDPIDGNHGLPPGEPISACTCHVPAQRTGGWGSTDDCGSGEYHVVSCVTYCPGGIASMRVCR
jgi:hypothetical protein